MKKTDCIYHSFKNDGKGIYSQCENYAKGLCPCNGCDEYIPMAVMVEWIDILKQTKAN